MALVQKRSSQRTLLLLGALAAIVVIGLLLYFLWIAPPSGPTVPSSGEVGPRDLPVPKDFGEAIFADPRYEALRPYGDLPVNTGNVGRENPFLPPS